MRGAEEGRLEALAATAAAFVLHGRGALVQDMGAATDLSDSGTGTISGGPSSPVSPLDSLASGVTLSEGFEEKMKDAFHLPRPISGLARPRVCVYDHSDSWKRIEPLLAERIRDPAFVYMWGGRMLKRPELEFVRPEHPSLQCHLSSPMDAHKIPYVHVYVTKCEGLEQYRALVRPRLKAWLEELQQKSNGLVKQEWLIFYVSIPDDGINSADGSSASKASITSKKVFDKIRTDMNDKQERCCQLAPEDLVESEESEKEWATVLERLCQRLTISFDRRCKILEDQVIKLEEQADHPGWNYCNYLVVKENLAFTWLQLGQYFDALRVFERLSMQFDDIMEVDLEAQKHTNSLNLDLYRTQILPLQGKQSGISQEDASHLMNQSKVVAGRLARKMVSGLSLLNRKEGAVPCFFLDTRRKPYREQIYKNSISILEIRLYLFMRSSLVLFAINRADEALRRALHFIAIFTTDLLHACEEWKADDGYSMDLPDAMQAKMVAFSLGFYFCFEMVCASHAAERNQEGKAEADTDELSNLECTLFQAELITHAIQFLESMVDVIQPSQVRNSQPDGNCAWMNTLPDFLKGQATGKPNEALKRMRSWLPVGFFEAMEHPETFANLYNHLLLCQAAYSRAAMRPRCALRFEMRRARFSMFHKFWGDAARSLERIESGEHLKGWGSLFAECKLLGIELYRRQEEYESVIRTCAEILCLPQAAESQKKRAQSFLNEDICALHDEYRLSCRKYPILKAVVLHDGEKRICRHGEKVFFLLEIDCNLPEEMDFDRIYLRLIKLEEGAGEKVAGGDAERSHELVRYRTTEDVEAAIASLEESAEDTDELASLIEDEIDTDIEEWESLPKERSTTSTSLTVDVRARARTVDEQILSPDLAGQAGDDGVEETKTSTTIQQQGKKKSARDDEVLVHWYLEARNVKLRPGSHQLEIIGHSYLVDKARFIPSGTFAVDRIGFQKGACRLIQPELKKVAQIKLIKAPPVFSCEVISPHAGFIALDADQPRECEVVVKLRLLNTDDEDEIKSVEASISDGDAKHSFRFKNGHEAVCKEMKFVVRGRDLPGLEEVDKIMKPGKTDMQVLRRKGVHEQVARSGVRLNLLIEKDVAPLEQELSLDMRFGKPFEVTQCVRYVAGELLYQIVLKSNLPRAVVIRNTEITGKVDISPLREKLEHHVRPGQELHLTFVSPVPVQEKDEEEVHEVVFSAKYDDKCVIKRKIFFKQELNRRCLMIESRCINLDPIHVGSPASFEYHLSTPEEDKTVHVESCFHVPGGENVINVSSSPLRKRNLYQPEKDGGIAFMILFDQNQWMILGRERGVLREGTTSVSCDFIPLQSGFLSFPVLELVNMVSTEKKGNKDGKQLVEVDF